ncbi:hypothetical protein ONZ43_g3394 [Nemania bipapillata]|uniref:Uncharacterized protein n=1 Tax=Nemania bipapillata TaxID=110536 RepID=A0ACC2IWW7_9PEZI|nr:hypothetical protein ONZ43_g3394 [Nemania bipapillata]
MSDGQPISDSLSKKRARDRRAQHNLRKKREALIHTLEQRIADLENELESLRQGCYNLRCENEILKSRQALVRRLVTSWTDHMPSSHIPVAVSGDSMVNVLLEPAEAVPSQAPMSAAEIIVQSPVIVPAAPEALESATRPQRKTMEDLTSPPWNITPFHLDTDLIWSDLFCIANPELVHESPEAPRPLELLFGSKTNMLAHAVCHATRQWRCRDPERLAAGWITYHLIKWMTQPSERRFSLLPEFQRPVGEQLCTPHPYFVDCVVWPRLRTNIIKTQHIYDPRDVMGMLSCCMKVRWPWNETFLEPGDDGEFVFKASFRETFMKLEGWGMTKEFLDRFPLLAQDLDVSSILFNFT